MTNIYTKGETDGLLNAKQATLSAATTLLGTGGSITGINFNTVINKPTYTSPLSSNVSTNVISVDLSSKQDTLTAATNLLGVGTAITAIDYAKITINKPTNFQADWTTTVINRPTNFQADWTTTVINRPTNFQADWTSTVINRPTNFQADWTSTVINRPSTFPATMTDIYTKGETNTLLNAKEATLTFSSPIIRTTNTISLDQTLINFNNLLNRPDMNLYLLKSGGAMTGNLTNTDNISVGTTNISSRLTINNIVEDREFFDHTLSPMTITHQTRTSTALLNDPQPIIHLCRQGTGGQAYGSRATISLCRYENSGVNSRTRMDISLANSVYDNINIMTLLSSGNVGIGTTNPGIIRLYVNGTSYLNGDINVNGTLRIDNSNKFSLNGTGNFEIDASGVIGGRFIINSSGNVGIGITEQSQKLYVNGTTYLNGNTTINGDLTTTGTITSSSGVSNFKFIYITNPNNTQTHFPYTNGQNYIRGKLNIDNDELFVGGATTLNSTLTTAGLLRHRQSFNYGETLIYTVNFNGGNQAGWFWTTNNFWDGFGTVSYLTIAINATGNGAVWFGRAFLGAGGGFYSIIQDYRTPDGPTNTISVVDYWGPLGANTLRISIANPVYGGNFVIKVSG